MEEEDLYGDLINTSGDVGDGLLKGQVCSFIAFKRNASSKFVRTL